MDSKAVLPVVYPPRLGHQGPGRTVYEPLFHAPTPGEFSGSQGPLGKKRKSGKNGGQRRRKETQVLGRQACEIPSLLTLNVD